MFTVVILRIFLFVEYAMKTLVIDILQLFMYGVPLGDYTAAV